jgi:hypothetical protein
VKAIELVRRVVELRERQRARGRGAMASAARLVALRVMHATTATARAMQSFPVPPPRPAERVVLSTAASQLRAMVDAAAGAPSGDAEVDAALATLAAETLALVDKMLATDPELTGPRRDAAALGPATSAHEADTPPTKIRF